MDNYQFFVNNYYHSKHILQFITCVLSDNIFIQFELSHIRIPFHFSRSSVLIIILVLLQKISTEGEHRKKALCDVWKILSKLGLKYLPANVTDYSGFNCCLKNFNVIIVLSFQWLGGISMLVNLKFSKNHLGLYSACEGPTGREKAC